MAVDITSIGIELDTRQLKTGTSDLDRLGKTADQASESADKVGINYKRAGLLVGAAMSAAVVGLTAFIKSQINAADAAIKTAQQIGIQVETLTGLQHAASLAGVSNEVLTQSLGRFNRTIIEAQQGSKQAATAFSDLGINITDSNGAIRSTEQLLLEVADRFEQYADSASKTSVAQDLFGRSGQQLIPLLNQGGDAIRGMMEQARALGLVMDTETAQASERLNDSVTVLQGSFRGMINNVLREMVPVMDDITGLFLDLATNSDITEIATKGLTATLKGLVTVAITVASSFTVAGQAIGATAAALVQAAQGNFSTARDIIQMGFTDAVDTVSKSIDRINKLWSGDYAQAGRDAVAITSALKGSKDELVRSTNDSASATRGLTEAEREYQRVMQNRKSADEEIQNLTIINHLVKQGMDLEEARFQVESARKGLLPEQVKELQKQKDILDDILYSEKARADRINFLTQQQQKAYDDELKRIEEVKKANERASQDYLREVKRAEEERRRQAERTARDINRSLTDALLRGFESGLSFAENFRRSLINMFNTLVLRPVIEMILSPVTGALGGIFGGAGGGIGGISDLFGAGKNLLTGIQEGFSGLNNSLTSAIGDLGTFLSTGKGGLGDFLGGVLGQYQGTIASALPFASAAFSLLTGDVKGAITSGAGAAIGTALGGPVGGLIGSALGSVVGGLFGGSGERFKQVIQAGSGSFSGGEFVGSLGQSKRSTPGLATGVMGLNEAFASNFGELLSAFGLDDTVRTGAYTRLRRTSGRTVGQFNASFAGGSVASSGQYAGDGDMAAGFQQFASVVMGPLFVQAIKKSSLADGVKRLFDGLSKQDEVQSAVQAVIQLNQALKDMPTVFDAVRFAFMDLTNPMTIQQLTATFAATQKFTELFYTAEENFQTFTAQLNSALSALNLSLPDTREGFRALVDGIDVVNEATYKQFAALVELAPAADQYYKFLESQKKTLREMMPDMNQFGSLVAFQRAQSYAMSGRDPIGLPSYDVGTAYVPNTGPAILHQGERVLTASDNKNLSMEIRALRMEMMEVKRATEDTAKNTRSTSDILVRVTRDGDALVTETA
jgi:hypothetical protein